jgi:hypothetical protein
MFVVIGNELPGGKIIANPYSGVSFSDFPVIYLSDSYSGKCFSFTDRLCSPSTINNLQKTYSFIGSSETLVSCDLLSNPFNERGKDSGKPVFKPLLKMIIFQNSLNLISSASGNSGTEKNLSKQTILNLCTQSISHSQTLHKIFLSLDAFSIPFESQKQIIQNSIIKC